jgi:hypothetical protein
MKNIVYHVYKEINENIKGQRTETRRFFNLNDFYNNIGKDLYLDSGVRKYVPTRPGSRKNFNKLKMPLF